MEPVRIALLGCGQAALTHHLPALVGLPGVQVVALAEPDDRRRAAAGARVPEAVATADWREAIETAEPDAIVICLPNTDHAMAGGAAFRAGRHAFVEKPIACSLAEADLLLDAWRRSGAVGMAGFNYRFNPLYQAARLRLREGRIGEPLVIRSAFTIPGDGMPSWKRGRRDGGGALLDLGSHHVDLVRWLVAEPVEARAEVRSRASEDDVALVRLRLEGGIEVQSLFAFGTVSEERLEIYGTEGRLVVDRGRQQSVVVEEKGRRSWASLLGSVPRSPAQAAWLWEKRRTPGHEPSYRAALAAFVEAVRSRSNRSPDLEDGRACLAVLDAAERSAELGRAVAVAGPGMGNGSDG
ncbi:MAG: Gfo/Idh/MocA family protein [Gemmatimonadota bacterium]